MPSKKTPDLPVTPLEHSPLHERVYDALRKSIMAGQFTPGQQVTVRGLAEAFGTSPMPVRASISRLVAAGGLYQRSNGTLIIPKADKRTFRDVMELRALLEGEATRKATPHIGATQMAELEAHAKDMAQAIKSDDIVAYLQANRRFKFSIYRHCESPTLLSIIENLWLKAGPFLRYHAKGLTGIANINYHEDALRYMKSGKAKPAGNAIRRDILAGCKYLLETAGNWGPEDSEAT